MALTLSTYVDPGVYIGEVIVPGAVNIATTPALLGVIGIGSREKQVTNEAVTRGLVEGAALTLVAPSGTGDAITAPVGGIQTLTDAGVALTTQVIGGFITVRGATNASNNGTFLVTNRPSPTSISYSNPGGVVEGAYTGTWTIKPFAIIGGVGSPIRTNRALQNTTVFRDNKALSDSFVRVRPAHIETAAAGPFALVASTNDAISIEMDGKVPLTLIFTAAAGATTVNGAQVTVRNSTIAALATATLAEVAAAINEGLNPTDATANAAVTALGYGAAYASAARVITGVGLFIVSPTTTPSSDVRVSDPFVRTAVTTIFGAAGALNRDSPTILEFERVVYNAASVYTADYVNINDTADALVNAGVLSVLRVGTSPGIGTFTESTDFALASDAIDWTLGAAARLTGSISGTFDLTANTTIRLSIDGRASIDIVLTGLASPPIGYANAGSAAAATAAEVANNINAVLAGSAVYGSRYKAVAAVLTVGASTYVMLTSPGAGAAGSVTVSTPSSAPANDATAAIFGLQATQLPSTVIGTGREPAAAAIYYASYMITRPAADYNVQKRFLSEAQAAADLGVANAQNPLMIAVRLAFRQGISSMVVVQVNDSALPGSPTRNEFATALNATVNSDLITEVVVLSTDLAVQIDLKDHIESESSPTRKHYRRGWFGMPINTDPGDRDTPDTFVYRAQKTLQVATESPGRGRMILVAPPQPQGVTVSLTQTDGSLERVSLDSTYLAAMWAARQASFTTPSATLAGQTVAGINVDDIDLGSIWAPPQRHRMAESGVFVTTADGGLFKVLDPCTTEQGAGGLPGFAYPASSAQKDNITRKVDRALAANIVNVVPTDLSDFITDIRIFIGDTIMAEIPGALAPFRNADGTTRRIDYSRDIEVDRDPEDPTKFYFRYFINLKYPALRLFGEFSVDNPFFSTAQAA